jgi:hypothetical protein
MVNWKVFPKDLIIYILSFLNIFSIRKYSVIANKYLKNTILNEVNFYDKKLFQKILIIQSENNLFLNLKKIYGFSNNLMYCCYFCNLELGSEYNVIFCKTCSIEYTDIIHYPELCTKCANNKIKKGVLILTECNECNKKVQVLNIKLLY